MISLNDYCVICDNYVPEGSWVCHECRKKILKEDSINLIVDKLMNMSKETKSEVD